MTVKALGFDLDDTLYSHFDYYNKIFNTMEQAIVKTNIDFEKFYSIFQEFSIQEYENYMAGAKTKDEYKIDRVLSTYKYFGFSIKQADAIIFNSLYLYFQNKIELRKGVSELFELATSQGIKLFILTNGPSDDQRRKLNYLNLDNYIHRENWFISDELGVSKPNREIYEKVQDYISCKGEEIVYIGDSLDNDAIGANEMGWIGIWLNNTKDEGPNIRTITSISKVANFLKKI